MFNRVGICVDVVAKKEKNVPTFRDCELRSISFGNCETVLSSISTYVSIHGFVGVQEKIVTQLSRYICALADDGMVEAEIDHCACIAYSGG